MGGDCFLTSLVGSTSWAIPLCERKSMRTEQPRPRSTDGFTNKRACVFAGFYLLLCRKATTDSLWITFLRQHTTWLG